MPKWINLLYCIEFIINNYFFIKRVSKNIYRVVPFDFANSGKNRQKIAYFCTYFTMLFDYFGVFIIFLKQTHNFTKKKTLECYIWPKDQWSKCKQNRILEGYPLSWLRTNKFCYWTHFLVCSEYLCRVLKKFRSSFEWICCLFFLSQLLTYLNTADVQIKISKWCLHLPKHLSIAKWSIGLM